MKNIRIAAAQINSTLGDFTGNRDKIIRYISKAVRAGVDIVVFPELAVCGYPPEDMVMRTDFIEKNIATIREIAQESRDIGVIVGYIERSEEVYNSAAFIYDGRIYGTYRKMFLPNYGVFDEKRYFTPGRNVPVFKFGDTLLGINICEDIWYPDGPAATQAVMGAGIILNLNASPYQAGKWKFRERMVSTRAADNAAYIVYANMVGGQDELIYEGGSMVFSPTGDLIARGEFFEEDILIVDLDTDFPFRTRIHDLRVMERLNLTFDKLQTTQEIIPYVPHNEELKKTIVKNRLSKCPTEEEEVYKSLVLGVKDYVHKNGFEKAVIGLSGGIDSALVLTIAADALGAENITALFMPSRYSSDESREDSVELAQNLGVELIEISIDKIFEGYLEHLAPVFGDLPADATEMNLQARIRGNLLMAYSNKLGSIVLTTGNKSEMAVGYATLYGDMAGGFAVIKDIPKTLVYKLSHYRNEDKITIPIRILEKAPSAELAEDQKDSDDLPPYEVLDPILKALIEDDREIKDIVEMGYKEKTVRKVARLLQFSEYKRRQAPPGIKITPRAFGRDRRYPITNKFVP